MIRRRIVVAVPCHRDEPSVAVTVAGLAASAALVPATEVRLVVCINGPEPAAGPAAAALARCDDEITIRLLAIASKPAAWSALRAEPADIHVFADADISVEPSALPALVAALDASGAIAATGAQAHTGEGIVARVARVPHRLAWGGLLGTLYAVKTEALPDTMPDDIILDDAWLFGTLGGDRIAAVPAAVATVQLPTRWRDLWRQRVRAERGKQQLKALGVATVDVPRGATATSAWRAFPPSEWPYVAALAAVKIAAATRARFGESRWDLATTTKGSGTT